MSSKLYPVWWINYGKIQFSWSVVSNSLQPHGLQHTRPPCPLPTPRACSNSCPSSQWWHPTISSSVVAFFSCFQSSPASVSFPVSQSFASGDQSIRTSASASVLSMNVQDWFPWGLTVWSPCSPRDSQESSPTPQFKTSILRCSAFFMERLKHYHHFFDYREKHKSVSFPFKIEKLISYLIKIQFPYEQFISELLRAKNNKLVYILGLK